MPRESCLAHQGNGPTLPLTNWSVISIAVGNVVILGMYLGTLCVARSRPTRRGAGAKPAYGLRVRLELEWFSGLTLSMTLTPLLLYALYSFTSAVTDTRAQDIACNFVYFPPMVLLFCMPLLFIVWLPSWLRADSATKALASHVAQFMDGTSHVLVLPTQRGGIANAVAKVLASKGADSSGGSVTAYDPWDAAKYDREWAEENAAREGVAALVHTHASPVAIATSPLPCADGDFDVVVLPFLTSVLGTLFDMTQQKVDAAAPLFWSELHRALRPDGTVLILSSQRESVIICEALRTSGRFTDVRVDSTATFAFSAIKSVLIIARALPASTAALLPAVKPPQPPLSPRPRAHTAALAAAVVFDCALFLVAMWATWQYWPALAAPRTQPFSVNCGALITGLLESMPIAIIFHYVLLAVALAALPAPGSPLLLARMVVVSFIECVLLGTLLFQMVFWAIPLGISCALAGHIGQSWISLISTVVDVGLMALLCVYAEAMAQAFTKKEKVDEERLPLIN